MQRMEDDMDEDGMNEREEWECLGNKRKMRERGRGEGGMVRR